MLKKRNNEDKIKIRTKENETENKHTTNPKVSSLTYL